MNNKILYTILFVIVGAIIFLFIDRQNLKNKSLENFTETTLLESITNLGTVAKQLTDNDTLTIPGNVIINGTLSVNDEANFEDKLTVKDEANIGNAYVGSNGDKAQFKHKDNHDSDGFEQGNSGNKVVIVGHEMSYHPY